MSEFEIKWSLGDIDATSPTEAAKLKYSELFSHTLDKPIYLEILDKKSGEIIDIDTRNFETTRTPLYSSEFISNKLRMGANLIVNNVSNNKVSARIYSGIIKTGTILTTTTVSHGYEIECIYHNDKLVHEAFLGEQVDIIFTEKNTKIKTRDILVSVDFFETIKDGQNQPQTPTIEKDNNILRALVSDLDSSVVNYFYRLLFKADTPEKILKTIRDQKEKYNIETTKYDDTYEAKFTHNSIFHQINNDVSFVSENDYSAVQKLMLNNSLNVIEQDCLSFEFEYSEVKDMILNIDNIDYRKLIKLKPNDNQMIELKIYGSNKFNAAV